jgi:hypothetical protein
MKLLLIWIIVGIPLAWGVMQSVKKSMPLFSPPAAATAPK